MGWRVFPYRVVKGVGCNPIPFLRRLKDTFLGKVLVGLRSVGTGSYMLRVNVCLTRSVVVLHLPRTLFWVVDPVGHVDNWAVILLVLWRVWRSVGPSKANSLNKGFFNRTLFEDYSKVKFNGY